MPSFNCKIYEVKRGAPAAALVYHKTVSAAFCASVAAPDVLLGGFDGQHAAGALDQNLGVMAHGVEHAAGKEGMATASSRWA